MRAILLVEDDPILGRGVKVGLEVEGYTVCLAKTLCQAREVFSHQQFDLILLDLGLPDGSGIDFCQHVRELNSNIPVVILTAQTDENTVVRGFDAGASDYVKKPFGSRELHARIKAHLRSAPFSGQKIEFGGLQISIEERSVQFNGEEVSLNRRLFDILVHFVKNAGKVITRDGLINAIDPNVDIYDRTIDSHLSQLRSKLKKCGVDSVKINSIYGIGYRLES